MSYTLIEKLKIRLKEYTLDAAQNVVFNNGAIDVNLSILIDKAKKDIIAYRHYPSYYTEEEIETDIENNYEGILIDLVLYDYSLDGADYQTGHNENGVNRTFISKDKILGKIIPFCKVL